MKRLSQRILAKDVLKIDKKNAIKIGPCGIGKKAVYLNSFYFDRIYYISISSIDRIFKRVAMSQGGFSGKGVFASISYLVVVYDGGKEKQCIFKREEQVDEFLSYIKQHFPDIPTVSETVEKKRMKKQINEKTKKAAQPERQKEIEKLKKACAYLEKSPELYKNLSKTAKEKRIFEQANPVYRWLALTIVLIGIATVCYGIWYMVMDKDIGVYLFLLGLAAVLLFTGTNTLPIGKNTKKYVDQQWRKACSNMEKHIKTYEKFPLPVKYAHPATIRRMIYVLEDERANTCEEALEVVKEDLKKLNASVSVSKEEYDEIMSVKPMFLIENYR